MSQDFLGSIAQEDVQFVTQILRTSTPGDNYWKLMMFLEESRFILDPTAFIAIPGTTLKVATVNGDTYASVVSGLARSWLFDFFVSGTITDAYLVMIEEDVDADPADFIAGMDAAYDQLKAYAYWKTVCAGDDNALTPEIAVALAAKCAEDKDLLSAPPLYPFTSLTPEDPETDPIYAALKAADLTKHDAIMTVYADEARNGSLFRLGQALAFFNDSGTFVGNNMDYIASGNIAPSGEAGGLLPRSVRDMLKGLNISFFKPVGDGTGNVAAVGAFTLAGDVIQANWIVAYINFMSKCLVANYITRPNRMRNPSTYRDILDIMSRQIYRFGPMGSQRLEGIVITAPAFANLPPSKGDEIIIPNAWSATYTDQVRAVRVFGTLTIAG